MTKQFVCEECNYSTNRLFNLTQHYGTKKHIANKTKTGNCSNFEHVYKENIKYNNFFCKNCSKEFNRKANRDRHYKTCNMKRIDDKIDAKDNIIKKLK